jgi:anti-anti-sigma factor
MISPGRETYPFRTELTASGATAVFATGLLTFPEVHALREQLLGLIEGGATRVVVDLSKAAGIDSSGVGALVSGLKAARARGGDLRLVAPPPAIADVLGIMRLDELLVASDSTQNAFPQSAG